MKSLLRYVWPQSLLGRLILIIFTGLIVILAISTLINHEERGRLLLQFGGKETANRIANTVILLDSLDIQERERIIPLLNIPPQRVTLLPPSQQPQENTPVNPQATVFQQQLETELNDNRPIFVRLNTNANVQEIARTFEQERQGRHMGMRHTGRPGHMRWRDRDNPNVQPVEPARASYLDRFNNATSYFIQIQLEDGQWVTFDTFIPKDELATSPRAIWTLAFILLGIFVLTFVTVRWVTRPLHVLSQAADALGKDINHPPLPEKGPTEIKSAAHAFNSMQQRLKNLIEDRTHIFAAMSHDLKTPITRLRLRAEMLDVDTQRESIEKDLKEMESMVTEALLFMRGIDTLEEHHPVNISSLLESLQSDYDEMGKKVTITGQAKQPLLGSAPLLKRCFVNLIDNAIFYGQSAHISIEDATDYLTIHITDQGPGIPEDELSKVCDPFYRVEHSRNRQTGGTGLGLAIVRNIVQAHRGSFELKNVPQAGLQVTLRFPRKK